MDTLLPELLELLGRVDASGCQVDLMELLGTVSPKQSVDAGKERECQLTRRNRSYYSVSSGSLSNETSIVTNKLIWTSQMNDVYLIMI